MHEASVASRIVETVREFSGLRTIYVSVGRYSCVHPAMLQEAFSLVKQGTCAECAELVTVPTPGEDISVLSVEVEDAQD